MKKKQVCKLSPVLLVVLLGGCTLNEGDPQTTLCQKLTTHLMNTGEVQWGQTSKTPGEDRSMNVTIRWDSQDAEGTLPMQATCRYLSNEDDDGQEYELNIVEGYQSLPDTIIINGHQVRQQDLYTAIQKVTGQAFRETLSEGHLRKKVGEAGQVIKEGSQELREKAGEVLQKAGEHLQK